MYQRLIPIGTFIAVFVAVFAILQSFRPAAPAPTESAATTSVASSTTAASSATPIKPAVAATLSAPATTFAPAQADRSVPAGPSVTIKVADASYVVPFSGSETALDAMRSAEKEGLVFSGENYPGLGFFVESIGGKKNGDGFYWILYINDTSSDVGVSALKLHSGDIVEWRYEKSY